MKNEWVMRLARTALAVTVLAPTAACAKPVDQAARSEHQTTAKAAGITLSTFRSRHEKKLLAADTDGNGKVSRAEFLAAAEAGKRNPTKRFVKLDANGDGVLDKLEIEAMLSRRFKRMDTNGDGMLSAAERGASHARKTEGSGDGSES